MKPIFKKTLIISSSILVPASLLSLSFGLYFGSSNIERISKKGIFTLRVNENLNNQGYNYDYSATYGSPLSTNRLSLLVVNEILHLETEGKFVYDQENQKVISPSYESFKFSTAKAIVLNFVDASLSKEQIENGQYDNNQSFQLIFNSDDAEVKPAHNDRDFVVTKDSNNPRSINNTKVFGEIIKEGFLDSKPDLNDPNLDISKHKGKKYVMKSMGITFTDFNENGKEEEPTKWVYSNGNKSKYNVKAEDMFYSLKRTQLFDKEYRRSHGGSAELDKYFIEKTATTKIFGETQKFPNEYLFDFFGIDKNKMYKKETAIEKVNINTKENGQPQEVDAFIFNFNIFNKDNSVNQDTSFSVLDIIKKYLSNSLTFSLAPSEYIDEMNQNNSINEINSNLKITGEAKDYGIYTYGQTREKTLFASYYIPVSASAGREIFEYNKHHANKKWVDSVENVQSQTVNNKEYKYKTINRVIVEYAGAIDTSTFVNQSFNSFLNGTLSQVDYSQISAEQKQKLYGDSTDTNVLIQNSEKNGLQPTKKVNVSSLTSRMVWQANPINNSNYTFNDNYSKLVYGYSKDELKNGQAVIANSFFAGYGFAFRLLIQASINWNQFIEQAFKGIRDVWLSGAAQDAKFSSFDPNSLTPHSFNELGVNDLQFYDEYGNLQTVTLKDMKKLSIMTEQEIEQEIGQEIENIQQFKMQSPKFKMIQASMKKLLDSFYQRHNLNNNEKIEFNIAYPFADQDETKSSTTKYIVDNVINKLDPRIKANFVEPTSREQMLQEINQRSGAFNANLWSYDYEGIGSYIAAFFSDGGGINLINAVGIFSKNPNSDKEQLFNDRVSKETLNTLQANFPKFTELSKYIRDNFDNLIKAENNNVWEGFLVENWDLLNNKQMNSINDFFTNPEHQNEINPINVLPAILKAFEADASWEKNGTTPDQKAQGWVDLIKEFNSIKGVSIDTESSVDKLTNVNYTLFLSEYIIPLSKYGIQLYSDFKYEVD